MIKMQWNIFLNQIPKPDNTDPWTFMLWLDRTRCIGPQQTHIMGCEDNWQEISRNNGINKGVSLRHKEGKER